LTVVVPVWSKHDKRGPKAFLAAQVEAAMGNSFVVEVLTFLSAAHQDSVYPQRLSQRARKHKYESIRLLNQNVSAGLVNDTTILAVVILALASANMALDSVRSSLHVARLQVLGHVMYCTDCLSASRYREHLNT
jgi:hypothetical protein